MSYVNTCVTHTKKPSSRSPSLAGLPTLVSIAERTVFFELSVLENQYSSAYSEGLPVFMRYTLLCL